MDNNTNSNLNNDVMQNNTGSVTPNVPLEQPRSMRFDPMTGEPVAPIGPVEPVVPNTPINEQIISETTPQINSEMQDKNTNSLNNVNDAIKIQNELQSIPTVEQGKDAFINNVQSMNKEKKEEKKEGVNFVFIIILFIVILAAILFLFPFLLDYI